VSFLFPCLPFSETHVYQCRLFLLFGTPSCVAIPPPRNAFFYAILNYSPLFALFSPKRKPLFLSTDVSIFINPLQRAPLFRATSTSASLIKPRAFFLENTGHHRCQNWLRFLFLYRIGWLSPVPGRCLQPPQQYPPHANLPSLITKRSAPFFSPPPLEAMRFSALGTYAFPLTAAPSFFFYIISPFFKGGRPVIAENQNVPLPLYSSSFGDLVGRFFFWLSP